MPRLLHLADLHLGWAPRDLPPAVAEARRAVRDARLDEAVALAIDERVDAVLVVGDLFETFDPPAELASRTRATLGRLERAGIALVTVPGNHDELTYAASVYRREAERWPGLVVRSPMPAHVATLTLAGQHVHLHALAYVGGVTDESSVLAALPPRRPEGLHVFAAHGTLVHGDAAASGSAGGVRERSLPLPRDRLASAGYDYVALGHVHRPSEERLGGTVAVYPGCVGGKGFDDPGSRAWTLVELGPQGARVERRPHRPPYLRDLDLDVTPFDDHAALEAALLTLLGDATDDVVRVRLAGAAAHELDLEALHAAGRERAAFLRLDDRSSDVSERLLEAWATSPTVRGAFVRRLRERIEATDDAAERRRLVRALRYGLDAMAASS